MAIENLGISTVAAGSTLDYVYIRQASTPSAIYVRWHTLTGAGTIKSFTVSACLRLVRTATKGVSESQYTGWSEWSTVEFPVAQCKPTADSTGFWWARSIDIGGIFTKWAPHGYAYNTRDNDEIQMQFKVYANYEQSYITDTGQSVSPTSSRTVRIAWVPSYTITEIAIVPSGVQIKFDRPGWTRTDDTFTLTKLQTANKTFLKTPYKGKVGNGTVVIPTSALNRAISPETLVFAQAKIDAAYRTDGFVLATAVGSTSVTDKSTSSTPAVSVIDHGDYFSIKTSDTADKALKSTRVIIKLRGYSEDFDTVDTSIGSSVAFRFAPLDRTVIVDVRGYNGDAYSTMVSVNATATSNGDTYIQDMTTPTVGFKLHYGTEVERKIKRDRDVVKLANRARSSAYFGTGAEVSMTITGNLIDLEGVEQGTADIAENVAETSDVVIVRRPGGKRAKCAIDTMSVTRGRVSPVVDVQIGFDEVV